LFFVAELDKVPLLNPFDGFPINQMRPGSVVDHLHIRLAHGVPGEVGGLRD